MSQEIPQHILQQLEILISEGKSAKEIAFMMHLDEGFVSNEMARVKSRARHIQASK